MDPQLQIRDHLESQVTQNNRILYPKVAQHEHSEPIVISHLLSRHFLEKTRKLPAALGPRFMVLTESVSILCLVQPAVLTHWLMLAVPAALMMTISLSRLSPG